MAFSDITVKQERRLCVVNGKMGYFHCWEHYSRPVEPSPMIGGAPGGVNSYLLFSSTHRVIVDFNKMAKAIYNAGYRKGEK